MVHHSGFALLFPKPKKDHGHPILCTTWVDRRADRQPDSVERGRDWSVGSRRLSYVASLGADGACREDEDATLGRSLLGLEGPRAVNGASGQVMDDLPATIYKQSSLGPALGESQRSSADSTCTGGPRLVG